MVCLRKNIRCKLERGQRNINAYQENEINAGGITWKYLFQVGQFRGFNGSSGPFQSLGSMGRFGVRFPFSRFPGLSTGLGASFSGSSIPLLEDIKDVEDWCCNWDMLALWITFVLEGVTTATRTNLRIWVYITTDLKKYWWRRDLAIASFTSG